MCNDDDDKDNDYDDDSDDADTIYSQYLYKLYNNSFGTPFQPSTSHCHARWTWLVRLKSRSFYICSTVGVEWSGANHCRSFSEKNVNHWVSPDFSGLLYFGGWCPASSHCYTVEHDLAFIGKVELHPKLQCSYSQTFARYYTTPVATTIDQNSTIRR